MHGCYIDVTPCSYERISLKNNYISLFTLTQQTNKIPHSPSTFLFHSFFVSLCPPTPCFFVLF